MAAGGRRSGDDRPLPLGVGVALVVAVGLVAVACGSASDGAVGADVDRPPDPSIEHVQLVDVASEVGLDFRHGAFRWDTTGDPNAMMGAGLCWLDHDDDGWLDLFVVNTWSEGEWGRWYDEGALPIARLYHNDRGRFTDVTAETGVGLEVRGNGCVAGDLDGDGLTDLYVTTERENVLLWNEDGERFVADDGSAGVNTPGWQAGAAIGDVNNDGLQDLFVAGYANLNGPIAGADKGFPNTFQAEPDLLFLNQGAEPGQRPAFVDVAAEVGIEAAQIDYGLGAMFTDVDRDGDLDLYVANDTHPNRLYVTRLDPDSPLGFTLDEQGEAAEVADENAGMGVASGDYDEDGRPDLVVTNMARQGHAVFRSIEGEEPPTFAFSLNEMRLADLGRGRTGWGATWADLDLDTDLDLLLAHGSIPVRDLVDDREQLQAFENLTSSGERGAFTEVTDTVGLDRSGLHLARGLAAADYDNDGDVDVAVGTIGSPLALLRNTGAGGHSLVVAADPPTPGTIVAVTTADGTTVERELIAGSSYLSSEDPRAHIGLGENDVATVRVTWSDGRQAVVADVDADQVLTVEPDES